MKINPIGKLKRSVQSASLISKILFILCCIFGLLWLFGTPSLSVNLWFILTGLLGVLWLSSIALHSFKKGSAGKRNPFTLLVALSLAVMLLLIGVVSVWNPDYDANSEPINRVSARFQEYLNDYGAELAADQSGRLMEYPMNVPATDTNLILTDKNDKVIYSQNQWLTGDHETLRALLCPATYESGTGFMILVDEKGNVVSAFQVDSGYFGGGISTGYSSLTIPAQTEKDETPPLTASDPLYERYFPSFGMSIDSAAIRLTGDDALIIDISDSQNSDYVTQTRMSVRDWNGEEIIRLSGYSTEFQETSILIRALNALTDPEREAFKEYIAWLENALDAAQRGDGDRAPYRARILTSSDGSVNMYMLYKFDTEALFPMRERHLDRLRTLDTLHYTILLMIPAIIVFLACWMFVDAKKRGQGNPALWAILTLIGNVITWIIYMLIRPQMAVGVTGQQMPKGICPICGTKLRNDFIACPGCGILIRSRCKNCEKALENDWSFCPYCTSAVTKEIPGAEEEADETEAPAEE